MSKTPRVAIYLRVSTTDKGQSTDNQLPECQELAARAGEHVVTYVEQASAVKHRPEFQRMMKDAGRRWDCLVIWAIDRFGRSMANNVADITELDRRGVRILSVKESW